MRKKMLGLLILPISLSPITSFAGTQPNKANTKVSPWKSSVELGYIQTNGNTKSKSLNTKAIVQYEVGKWRHKIILEGFNSSTSNSTTGERYSLEGKSDYKLNEMAYFVGTGNYETDRFSGFDYQSALTLGTGYNLIKKTGMSLDLESGLGFRNVNPKLGDVINEGIIRFSGDFEWELSKNATFSQNLSTQIGKSLTSSKSVTALSTQVAGNLAMKTSFTVRNVSNTPIGTKRTDTETVVTLVYKF